jgi:multidrug efflux system membrane fusion protein
VWLVLALAIGALAWFLHSSAPQNNASAGKKGKGGKGAAGPLPVAVAKAHMGSIPVYQDGLGTVTAFYTVTVRSRVDGQLMTVPVKEGDLVTEGQLIAQIDPRPYQVQLEQAEGTMARDQAMLANAKVDLDRYRTLINQDAIPKQQLDTQVALVAQYEGNIKTDQANIDNAKLQLTYAHITAPITGRIGLRQMDPGNIVHASDTTGLLIITQVQPISVLFTIPEDDLPPILKKLRAGAHLPIIATNRDKSEKLATGTLLTIDNSIDPTTGTSRLKGIFENKDNALFPNQFVNIRVLVDTLVNQVIVPEVAVQQGSQGQFVYVVEGTGDQAKVRVQKVQVGETEGQDAQILSGLNAGDVVVTDGTDKLQNGSPVRPRTGGGPGAGAPGGRGGRKKGVAGPADKTGHENTLSGGAPQSAATDNGPAGNVGKGKKLEGNPPKAKENQ